MAKKAIPLTADELGRVKIFARWLGKRMPDPPGKPKRYTVKELEDLGDQFLLETRSWNLEPHELVTLARRYWAQKAAGTRAKRKRQHERKSARAQRLAELAKNRLGREQRLAAKRAIAALQGSFEL